MCDVRAADVRAETDWHACGEVCLCERDDAVEDDLAVVQRNHVLAAARGDHHEGRGRGCIHHR